MNDPYELMRPGENGGACEQAESKQNKRRIPCSLPGRDTQDSEYERLEDRRFYEDIQSYRRPEQPAPPRGLLQFLDVRLQNQVGFRPLLNPGRAYLGWRRDVA